MHKDRVYTFRHSLGFGWSGSESRISTYYSEQPPFLIPPAVYPHFFTQHFFPWSNSQFFLYNLPCFSSSPIKKKKVIQALIVFRDFELDCGINIFFNEAHPAKLGLHGSCRFKKAKYFYLNRSKCNAIISYKDKQF